MSDSPSMEGPGGYGAVPPPVVTPPPIPASTSAHGPNEAASPWLSIWTRPRATLRLILDTDPRRGVLRLAALGGIVESLSLATREGLGDTYSIPVVLAFATAGGAAAGLLGIIIFTAVLSLTGRWLGGRGRRVDVMAALAWANVPGIWGLLLWLPRAALLGGEIFHPAPAGIQGNPPALLLYGLLQIVQLLIALWGFAISLKCLGEAHAFSAWRALGALILGGFIVIVPIGLVVMAVQSLV
ncbi:MAG: YIP1 family protein [Acidobacteria bacterium]|nr:YIP1 family protein [Acidobacteriota bacterium]